METPSGLMELPSGLMEFPVSSRVDTKILAVTEV